jgi:ubiquitin C-terminal hydrolase
VNCKSPVLRSKHDQKTPEEIVNYYATPPSTQNPYLQNWYAATRHQYQLAPYEDPTNSVMVSTEKVRLRNISNSCYVNSIFQILLHSEYLWQLVKQDASSDLIQTYRNGYCNFFGISNTEQCDAVGFFNWILDKHEKYKDNWKLRVKTLYECQSCGHPTEKVRDDNMWIIHPTTDVPNQPREIRDENGFTYDLDLLDCIVSQQKEVIEKRCENCIEKHGDKTNKQHVRRDKITNHPDNLFLHLHLFEGKHTLIYECINAAIPGENGSTEAKYQLYDLQAVLVHRGSFQYGGHYMVYLQDKDGWYLYNDSVITRVDNITAVLSVRSSFTSYPLLWYTKYTEPPQNQTRQDKLMSSSEEEDVDSTMSDEELEKNIEEQNQLLDKIQALLE